MICERPVARFEFSMPVGLRGFESYLVEKNSRAEFSMPVGLRGFECIGADWMTESRFSMPVGLRGFEYDLKNNFGVIGFRCLSA